jgi:NAD(P)-dependent dehydrogenase (short-subunit alcohol dehydrogenase family)
MRLEGKVAVVTGAGSGMGKAMALRFVREGACVVGADINAGYEDIVELAEGRFAGVSCNVAHRDQCEALIETAESLYGGLDILCNNAGIMDRMQGPADIDDELWRRIMSVNVDGPMYLTRRAIPEMLKRGGGSIINTVSTACFSAASSGTIYAVSKHALEGLTLSTAWMHALDNIRCNAIAPGGTRTSIVSQADIAAFDPKSMGRIAGFHALMPKLLEPEDIADVALFLASDEARNVNGTIIPVDGGWHAV